MPTLTTYNTSGIKLGVPAPDPTTQPIAAEIESRGQKLADHLVATANPHGTTAAQVGAYTTSATDSLLAGKANASTVTAHIAATAAHGVTGAVVGTTDTQTLTNKTISGASNTVSGLAASVISSGTVATARLGSGTADSTTYLRGDQLWATVPAGNPGTVTSIALSAPAEIAVSNGTVTSAGTIGLSWASQTQGKVLAAPTSGTGTPTFRALVLSDIPALDTSKITSGYLATNRLGAGTADYTKFLRGDQTWQPAPIAGIVGVLNAGNDAGGLSVGGLNFVIATYLQGDGNGITNIAPSHIAGYPSDGTKALLGDGSWGTISGGGGGGSYLPLSGGTLTGSLNLGNYGLHGVTDLYDGTNNVVALTLGNDVTTFNHSQVQFAGNIVLTPSGEGVNNYITSAGFAPGQSGSGSNLVLGAGNGDGGGIGGRLYLNGGSGYSGATYGGEVAINGGLNSYNTIYGNVSIQPTGGNVYIGNASGNVAIGSATTPTAKLDVTGSIKSSSTVTATSFVGQGITPIGGIISWAKSFTNTPALPVGWVECNGQTLSDSLSPYNGQVIPNLNGASAGTKRFLRGSSTSGTVGGADTHTHSISVTSSASTGSTSVAIGIGAASSLPSYYEVVMIMRVK